MFIYAVFTCVAWLKLWKEEASSTWIYGIFVFLTIFIGYRFEIGVDWQTYEIMFLDLARTSLTDAMINGDAAYSLINWLVSWFGGQVWHVNLICAGIFCYGLMIFCKSLPRPGLALALAVPTLIIITAMGYTRQAVSVACIMVAYSRFHGSINWRWLAWLSVGVMFHRSTILVFPAFILAGSRHRSLSIAVGGIVGVAILFAVVTRDLGAVIALYFEGDIESSGALPRVLVGVVAGISLFLIRGRSNIFGEREKLVRNMAIMMIGLFPLYYLIPSTTVIDRTGILLVPFQSAVYAGFAASLERRPFVESAFTLLILIAYGALLLLWLLFATFADYWIPYENVLFQRWI